MMAKARRRVGSGGLAFGDATSDPLLDFSVDPSDRAGSDIHGFRKVAGSNVGVDAGARSASSADHFGKS